MSLSMIHEINILYWSIGEKKIFFSTPLSSPAGALWIRLTKGQLTRENKQTY